MLWQLSRPQSQNKRNKPQQLDFFLNSGGEKRRFSPQTADYRYLVAGEENAICIPAKRRHYHVTVKNL